MSNTTSGIRLTKTQISNLKTDIKQLSVAISKQISKKNGKYPVTSAQNAIACKLGHTSFSGLSTKSVPTEHDIDFSLLSALTAVQIFECYESLKTTDNSARALTVDAVEFALEDLTIQNSDSDEPTISLRKLQKILNHDQYCYKDDYTLDYGFPSTFEVSPKSEFFNELRDWDQFRVTHNGQYKCFTVNQFQHIYDKVPCFRVAVGRWYENGLCVGDQ